MVNSQKTKFHLLDWDFLDDMSRNMAKGVKGGRVQGDWSQVPATVENLQAYWDAAIRHSVAALEAIETIETSDALDDANLDKLLAAVAAVGCNAMILHNMARRARDSVEDPE